MQLLAHVIPNARDDAQINLLVSYHQLFWV
ncbi:Uncharacterised protein [Klebsiella pneumoniae]|nr:Uncharacterised protein [Klebsiella pneumoniae]